MLASQVHAWSEVYSLGLLCHRVYWLGIGMYLYFSVVVFVGRSLYDWLVCSKNRAVCVNRNMHAVTENGRRGTVRN